MKAEANEASKLPNQANELNDPEAKFVISEIVGRYAGMYAAAVARAKFLTSLHESDTGSHLDFERLKVTEKLVAVDVFVEKAKYKLTQRAKLSLWLAGVSFCAVVGVAVAFLWWITIGPAAKIPNTYLLFNEGWLWAILAIKSLTTGAVFLAGIYIFSALGKGFLNEWSMLMSKRHALRFGRIVVYLKDGQVEVKELIEAFGWNITPNSSFSSFSPEFVTKGIVGQITGVFQKGVDAGAKASGKSNER